MLLGLFAICSTWNPSSSDHKHWRCNHRGARSTICAERDRQQQSVDISNLEPNRRGVAHLYREALHDRAMRPGHFRVASRGSQSLPSSRSAKDVAQQINVQHSIYWVHRLASKASLPGPWSNWNLPSKVQIQNSNLNYQVRALRRRHRKP